MAKTISKTKLALNKVLYKLSYIDPTSPKWKGDADLEPGFYLVKRQWVWWLFLIPAVAIQSLKNAIITFLEYIIEINNFKIHFIDVKEGVDPKSIDKRTREIIRWNLMN